ncbi:MAG: hypothetical protein IJ600_09510 [Lachnospiraceae bacterium]|nr:hypothetical protein [Lachnospiraceae bacterium]
MAYFSSPKNRAMWNRELAELRVEKARRAAEGFKPKTAVQAEKEKTAVAAKGNDPRHRKINLAELERIEARASKIISGKIRRVKRPIREHARTMDGMQHGVHAGAGGPKEGG